MEHWELAYQQIAVQRQRRSRVKTMLRLGAGALLFTSAVSAVIAGASYAVG